MRLEDRYQRGELSILIKKEAGKLIQEIEKMNRYFGGIKDMNRLPGALFIVDPPMERIAVTEAMRMRHPDHRHVRHELQPGRDRLPDPVERRRDPRGQAHRQQDRRRGHRGAATSQGYASEADDTEGLDMASLAASGASPHRRTIRRPLHRADRSSPRRRQRTPMRPQRLSDRRSSVAQGRTEIAVAITAEDVKHLREQTGAGVMDCKKALDEAGGDFEKAVKVLREKGIATAEKKSDRETSQGIIDSYIHAGGRIGVLVEVNCETDFVARTDDFKQLVHDVAMQIAGIPTTLAITEEDLPADAEGSVEETVLLKQSFIKDSSKTIEDLVKEAIAQTGENIRIRRFTRFELGQ